MRSVPSHRYWGEFTGSSASATAPLGGGYGAGPPSTTVRPNTWRSVSSSWVTTRPTQACIAIAATTRIATVVRPIRRSRGSMPGGASPACAMANVRQPKSATFVVTTATRKVLERRPFRTSPTPLIAAVTPTMRSRTGTASSTATRRWPA